MSVHAAETVVMEPPTGWSALRLGDVWRARDLLLFFAWRDIKVRYAQASLGVAWAVLQPLLMMAVFTIFLGKLVKLPPGAPPYPVFALAGLVPWTFFASSLGAAAESLVTSANLVSRVWFPRLVLPAGAMVAWLPDVLLASAMLLGLMGLYGIAPPLTTLLLPVFVAFAFLAAASVGVWLAALNVRYRDVRYAVPFIVQLWLFATPVIYDISLVPRRFRMVAGLNPMTGVVEGYRWALLRQGHPPWGLMGISLLASTALLVGGLYYFRRVEHGFADVI